MWYNIGSGKTLGVIFIIFAQCVDVEIWKAVEVDDRLSSGIDGYDFSAHIIY